MKITGKLRKIGRKYVNAKREKIILPIQTPVEKEKILNGKVAVVTGGSGGIGSEIARKLIDLGAKVVITGTSVDKLEKVKKTISDDESVIKTVLLDLNNVSMFSSKVKDIASLFPEEKINILVNCAGIVSKHSFWDTTEEEFDNIIGINLKGLYFFSREVVSHMKEKGTHGHILNVSSSSSVRPAWTPYQLSKWAVNGFTKGLADLVISDGIVVNGIAPGPTATDIFELNEGDSINNPNNPSGRFALPSEVAALAAFLVSPSVDMILGDTFFITGGSGVISYHR